MILNVSRVSRSRLLSPGPGPARPGPAQVPRPHRPCPCRARPGPAHPGLHTPDPADPLSWSLIQQPGGSVSSLRAWLRVRFQRRLKGLCGGVVSSLDSIRPPYVAPVDPELLSTPGPSGSSRALEDPSSCCCHCCCCAPCWRRGFMQPPGGSCEQAERPRPGPRPCLVLMMKAVCIFTPRGSLSFKSCRSLNPRVNMAAPPPHVSPHLFSSSTRPPGWRDQHLPDL